MTETMKGVVVLLTLALFLLSASSITAFQSDELENDEEFGLEGGSQPVTNQKPSNLGTTTKSTPSTPTTPSSQRRRFSDPDSDSKIQFTLEHAFGDSDFVPAGTFTARLKSSSHGSSQTLTKLRFSRNTFTDEEKEKFKKILHDDDFYRIRLPSDVLSPPGRDYVVSSVKARCLPRDGLDEHFVIHMDGGNILAVNYGAPGACPYPRQMKLPSKWSFNSHTVLKSTELAPRTPLFVEDTLGGKNGEEEGVKPPERSFWAKYWMYLVPLGLIMMNAFTQAMNVPEEQATGQSGAQPAAIPRGQAAAIRRR